ncbi:MAG: C40 family peptidase [Bacteroidia bacterium]
MRITIFLILAIALPLHSSLATPLKKNKVRKYELLVNEALKYVGTPYKFGGSAPSGFDCSGFVGFVFKKYGINLPRISTDQATVGKRVSLGKAKKGDLIFFKGSNKRDRKIGHVGIVVSNKGEPVRFVHASTSRGVVVSDLSTTYYKERYRKVRCFKELNKKVKL